MKRFLTLFLILACIAITCGSVHAQQADPDPSWSGIMLAPKAFRAAAKKVSPSLVTIESYAGVGAVHGSIGGIRKQGEGNTTGVVISKDGYIVSSTFNFIKDPQTTTVTTHDGKQYYAEVVARDHTRKICVLKIKDVDNLVVPEMVPVDQIRIGQWAVSVGVGYGDSNPAISAGIISAKNRIGGRAIQTDANISPANYGGPLIDIEGRVLGICSPLSPNSQELAAGVEWYDSGIGFAVPLGGAENLVARLKSGKDIRAAWLGIRARAAQEGKIGIVIESVEKDGPADKAGLEKGDTIIRLAQQPTANLAALKQVLQRFAEDDSSKITVQRDSKEVDLEITFAARPENPGAVDEAEEEATEDQNTPEEKDAAPEKPPAEGDEPDDAAPAPDSQSNDDQE